MNMVESLVVNGENNGRVTVETVEDKEALIYSFVSKGTLFSRSIIIPVPRSKKTTELLHP